MGCRILHDAGRDAAVLYCSTSDWAFGPVFTDADDHDADERAEAFLRWLPQDARRYSDADLLTQFAAWRAQEAAQWAREEAAQWPEEGAVA
jgi:hypothetical protein